MKKYLLALFGIVTLFVLVACGNANGNYSESEFASTVETTTTQITFVTTTSTTVTTELQTTTSPPSTLSLDDRYYGNYMSIGVSNEWKQEKDNSKFYQEGVRFIVEDRMTWMFVYTRDYYGDNEEYINNEFTSIDILYENKNGIKFIRRKNSDDRTLFNCCNHDKHISVQFTNRFAENDMLAVMDTFEFEDDLASTPIDSAIVTTSDFSPKTTSIQTTVPESNSSETLGQKNALKSAKSYIDFSSFSYLELIEQLEYEKYSHEEAVYAADNCGADWNAEALESAKSYIDFSGFSYQGLLEQLEYEQFTSEQAQYGVGNCGADWFQEAAECAESYINFSSFSRDELLDQLLYEGFTQEQAEYGVQLVGY